ncbi:hypothetical protein C1O66_04055 [Paucibacter aquatile]|uniref:Uncharacterized protein n=1 Tax=Kinneretia aquatilis TaxID=2070761 RepID=A0A2N8KTN0_9BURK|nr:hypothetical protein [Paucibacter aquatile]PND36790.1 hypothetical protein C1O66_04055 [Paucibacter aquatile]WIV99638.1 hypothetical protein K9V56_009260 [Paucibacter aquatile]
MSTRDAKKGELGAGGRALFFLFGAYLLFGAALTAHDGKLFAGFPPQLDIAFVLFGESKMGAYVEALLAALLGLASIFLALAGGKRGAP